MIAKTHSEKMTDFMGDIPIGDDPFNSFDNTKGSKEIDSNSDIYEIEVCFKNKNFERVYSKTSSNK